MTEGEDVDEQVVPTGIPSLGDDVEVVDLATFLARTEPRHEPDSPADEAALRLGMVQAFDEYHRRIRGEGLTIDPPFFNSPTEGATDD